MGKVQNVVHSLHLIRDGECVLTPEDLVWFHHHQQPSIHPIAQDTSPLMICCGVLTYCDRIRLRGIFSRRTNASDSTSTSTRGPHDTRCGSIGTPHHVIVAVETSVSKVLDNKQQQQQERLVESNNTTSNADDAIGVFPSSYLEVIEFFLAQLTSTAESASAKEPPQVQRQQDEEQEDIRVKNARR